MPMPVRKYSTTATANPDQEKVNGASNTPTWRKLTQRMLQPLRRNRCGADCSAGLTLLMNNLARKRSVASTAVAEVRPGTGVGTRRGGRSNLHPERDFRQCHLT